MKAMQEKRVKVNQIELQLREYEGEGDAVIFLHFSGANLMMWQRMGASLWLVARSGRGV
jgi:hypothetical protein